MRAEVQAATAALSRRCPIFLAYYLFINIDVGFSGPYANPLFAHSAEHPFLFFLPCTLPLKKFPPFATTS